MITFLNTSISSSTLDIDALEFIKVAGITNSNHKRALNDLCGDLKSYGFWDKSYRIFPMIYAGTTSSILLELKTRTSLIEDTGYGSTNATFSNSGIYFNNGVNYYDSQTWTPDSSVKPGYISVWSKTNLLTSGLTSAGFGYINSQQNGPYILLGTNSISASLWNDSTYIPNYGAHTFSSVSSEGLFLYSNQNNNNGNISSNSNKYVFYLSRNGQILGTQSSRSNISSGGTNFNLGSIINESLLPNLYTNVANSQISWFSYGGGSKEFGSQINIENQEKFYEIVSKFQKALGR